MKETQKLWGVCLLLGVWISCGGEGGGGDDTISSEITAEECQDTLDNDGDGLIDCEEMSCSGYTFCEEPAEDSARACQDGVDNDGDGAADCDDQSCSVYVFCSPAAELSGPECSDELDNDGDGAIDCGDPDCQGYVFCYPAEVEITTFACQDGRDNDNDGSIDCADSDCTGYIFCLMAEVTARDCQDEIDNDEDGKIDCADGDCFGYTFCYSDEGTVQACQDEVDNDGDGNVDCADADCRDYTFCSPSEVAVTHCQDGLDNDGDGAVDCVDSDCLSYVFCSNVELTATQCQDGQDNDRDGAADCADADCLGYVFCSDREVTAAECQDGQDNDGDGAADCADADCLAYIFCSDREVLAAECQDGQDNDGDGATDCADTDCLGYVFCSDREVTAAECQDGQDNDSDSTIDCADADCAGYQFCTAYEVTATECQDGQDNDGDGATDCADSNCTGYVFCLSSEATIQACQDGLDNDSDGDIDCADGDCVGFTFCLATEATSSSCQDGLDNDGDGAADCDDNDCWVHDVCVPTHGYSLRDSWDETWDGLPRGAGTFAAAQAACAAAGGRLPTATELYRNNATSGTGDLADVNATMYLWTNLPSQASNKRVAVRLSDGAVSYTDAAQALQYRCVWPDRNGQGFDEDRCFGPPGDECYAVDGRQNIDMYDRPALDYVAAAHECAFYGSSIPMAAEWGDLIHAGLPNPTDQWVWTGNAAYWHSGNYGVSLIRWNTSNQWYWGYNNSPSMGAISATSDSRRFRCIGLASQDAVTLPDSPVCNGVCYTLTSRRSPLIADGQDRAPLDWATALETCRLLGATLPNQAEFGELVRSGWANGTNNWLWIGEPLYWYNGGYGNPMARWSGKGAFDWTYRPTLASLSYPGTAQSFRCVWRPDTGDFPVCDASEVIEEHSGEYQCMPYTAGDSNGNANPGGRQFVDCDGNAWDSIQRGAESFAAAAETCSSLGGRLPTANEIHAVRAGSPHCTPIDDSSKVSWLWTRSYSHIAGSRFVARVSDGTAGDAAESSAQAFRCIWPSEQGDLLSGHSCHGPAGAQCFQEGSLIADSVDRVAVSLPVAIQECAASGGHIPDLDEFAQLIHAGWPNGSNAWLWIAESLYWDSGGYGYAIGKWTGTGTAAWRYEHSSMGSLSGSTSLRPFRCVYSARTR